MARTALLVAGAAALPALAAAQSHHVVIPVGFSVVARSDLTFGNLVRGMSSTISAHDDYHAALFEVTGPANTPVRIELVLPSALVADAGPGIPLSFGAGDGFADAGTGLARGTTFNPRLPLILPLGTDGRLFLHVGATAHPDRLQAPGAYRAPIFVNLYNLGS